MRRDFEATPTALASEYIVAFRIDQKIGNNDNAYFRYKLDHGIQPTILDPINSNFNVISHQPAYDMQFNETHIFGSAIDQSVHGDLQPLCSSICAGSRSGRPKHFSLSDLLPAAMCRFRLQPNRSFPNGSNISQYQFIDDFTADSRET